MQGEGVEGAREVSLNLSECLHSFIHSLTHSFTPLTHSLAHSFTCQKSPGRAQELTDVMNVSFSQPPSLHYKSHLTF